MKYVYAIVNYTLLLLCVMIVVVDDQQHLSPLQKKKYTSFSHLYRRRWRKNQAMISSVILDKIIMVLKRRIEDKEVISGCITSRREVRQSYLVSKLKFFDTAKNSDSILIQSSAEAPLGYKAPPI